LLEGYEWTHHLISILQKAMDEDGDEFSHYNFLFEAILRFQLRNLTCEDDAIKAMSGIVGRVAEPMGTEFLEGLPVNIFPDALLFLQLPGTFVMRNSPPPRRRPAFPSWSWAGWTHAKFSWDAGLFDNPRICETPIYGRRTTWYSIRPKEKPQLVWKPSSEASSGPPSWSHDVLTNRPYALLCFHMLTAVFSVSQLDNPCNLFDRQGKLAGKLCPDSQPQFVDGQRIQVIIFPESSVSWMQEAPQQLYRFIHVEWDGDVYERRGAGILYLSSLEKSHEGLEWKDIVLG
jgi:hypothetical protein